MAKLPYSSSLNIGSLNVTETGPIDIRTVVSSVDDLTNRTIPNIFKGLVVNVAGTGDLYVFIGNNPRQSTDIANWVKVGGSGGGDVDLSEYAKLTDLADYLSSSDAADFVKLEDLVELTNDFVTESDLNVYVKTEDIVDFVKETDLKEYTKKEDLVDFLTSSDANEFVRLDEIGEILDEELADKFVAQSDLDVYVKTEDLVDFVTSSELNARLSEIVIPEVPENVSAFNNDAGYLTDVDLPDFLMESDLDGYVKTEVLEDYIPKTALDTLAKQSDLEGYVKTEDAIDFLTGSDLDDYARLENVPTEGAFPDGSDIEEEEASVDGYATVQDVMDYVNALLEKKKAEEDSIRYAYITGYALNGEPTDITAFNKFLLNETGDTEIEIYAPQEVGTYDTSGADLPSIKLTVDIPDGYSIKEAYIWSNIGNTYNILSGNNVFGPNPRYTSRSIDNITYYSYVRGPVDTVGTRGLTRYKIIITK